MDAPDKPTTVTFHRTVADRSRDTKFLIEALERDRPKSLTIDAARLLEIAQDAVKLEGTTALLGDALDAMNWAKQEANDLRADLARERSKRDAFSDAFSAWLAAVPAAPGEEEFLPTPRPTVKAPEWKGGLVTGHWTETRDGGLGGSGCG